MKHKLVVIILAFFLLFCGYFFYTIYEDAKEKAISDLNRQQLIHVQQAKRGIESFFENTIDFLTELSKSKHVIDLDEIGRQEINFAHDIRPTGITAITRVGGQGKIIYTSPFNPSLIKRDISYQTHIKRIMQTHQPVVSDIFEAVQGYKALALHIPVLNRGAFAGTIGVLVDFEYFAKHFLEVIRSGKTGYAWIINAEGTELYCPVPGHTGNSVFENCKDFPTIISMAKEMVKGRQGTTTYVFDRVRDKEVEIIRKHAVYMPIKIVDSFWSIVVATTEKEVLGSLLVFKNKLILLLGFLLLGSILFSYYVLKAFGIVKEEAKRKEMENALRESEEKFRLLFENSSDAHILYRGKAFIDCNQSALNMLGFENKNQLMAKHPNDISPEHQPDGRLTQDKAEEMISLALKNGSHRFEWLCRRSDGSDLLLDVLLNAISIKGELIIHGVWRDITHQKQMEDALQESILRQNEAIKAGKVGLWDWSLLDNKVQYSPEWKKQIGYEENEISDDFQEWESRVHPDDLEPTLKEVQKSIEQKLRDHRVEFRFRHRDGSYRWILAQASIIQDDTGRPIRMVGSHLDITERKQAEEALRESEARFRRLFEHSNDAIFIHTLEGKIRDVNIRACEMLGCTKNDFLEQTISQLHPKESLQEAEGAIRETSEKGAVRFETKFKKADGSTLDVEISSRVVDSEKGIVQGIVRDISPRKKAEKALRESEAFIKAVMDNLPVGIAVNSVNPDVEFEYMNDNFPKYYRTTRKALADPNCFWDSVYEEPEFRDKIKKRVLDDCASGDPERMYWVDVPITREGEETSFITARNTPVPDKQLMISTVWDVTERKLAEEALLKQQFFLQKAQELGRIGAWEIDIKKNELLWTDENYRIFGIPIGTELTYETFLQCVHPDDREYVDTKWKASFNKKPYDIEHRLLVDGKVKWVREKAELEFNEKDECIRGTGFTQDITDRKRAAADMESQKAFLDRIIDQSPFATWISDAEGTLQRANPALKKFLNVTDEQLVGKYNVLNDPLVEQQGLIPLIRTVYEEGKTITFICDWDTSDIPKMDLQGATPVSIEATMFPIHNSEGEITNVALNWIDITDRKEAEAALRESTEKYRRLVENLEHEYFFYSHDTNGVFNYVSPSIMNILGYSQEEFLTHYTEYLTDNPINKKVEYHSDLSTQGEKQPPYEVEISNKDGGVRRLEVSEVPVFDNEGKIVGVEGIAHDITERVVAEETRKMLETQLQQAHKMEAIGTLAGGIAHDFNNILTPILIQAELAKMTVSQDDPVQTNLGEIMGAGHRAKDLVKQILTFSRQSENQHVAIDIVPIFKETLKLLRASIPRTIDIVQNIKETPGMVLADPTQIQQIIMNLCTNAAQAMEEMGSVLELTLGNVELNDEDIQAYSDIGPGNYVMLKVSDTGTGIEPGIMDKIFDPFFTTKPTGEGTGMGLAMVHGIVKSHGGAINIYSEPGKGTTFVVLLPRIEKGTKLETKEPGQVLPKGNEKILFIDDELAIANLGQQMLERLGYMVETRTSSIEALKAFQNRPDKYDLVMTDMTMPNMTGENLAKELMRIRPNIPIIISTGFSIQMDEKKARNMGIKAFVMKPFIMKDVAETIRKVLDAPSD